MGKIIKFPTKTAETVTKTREQLTDGENEVEWESRLKRVRGSLERINQLMIELRQMSETKDRR